MQLILHSPWGGRINRAWGLALRKRFCVSFDRELQAAATDDGICISLVEQHSFPLSDVFLMLQTGDAGRESDSGRARLADVRQPLALERNSRSGDRSATAAARKFPWRLQRMRAEDLVGRGFSRTGDVPGQSHADRWSFPIIRWSKRPCAIVCTKRWIWMAWRRFSARIESGAIETLAIDTPAPSPMAHEILNANPYAFLDDAPLEERRARAVSLRRVDPWLGREFGRLDQAAIEEVRKQAWPEARNPDELHDLLLGVGLLPVERRPDWQALARRVD